MEAIERRFLWDEFFGPILRKSDFEALPQVYLHAPMDGTPSASTVF